MPGLVELMRDVRSRTVQVVDVATPSASPFARTLMFGYVGMFLYEMDAPLAERRAAALSLDSTLLAELLGSEAIRELLDPEVVAEIEAGLQRTDPERHVRDIEGTADLLRFVGDLTTAEAAARGVREEWLVELESARRALRVKIAGEVRWVAIEDAGRLRDALGAGLPVGVPEAFTEPVADPLGDLLARYARTRGPFPAAAAGPPLRARRRRRGGGARAHDGRRSAGPRRAAAHRRAAAAGRGRGVDGSAGPGPRARLLRRRGAAPDPAGLARAAARRGRTGRAGGPRTLPAALARDRRAPPAGTGARRRPRGRRAARRRADPGERVGVAGPARPGCPATSRPCSTS